MKRARITVILASAIIFSGCSFFEPIGKPYNWTQNSTDAQTASLPPVISKTDDSSTEATDNKLSEAAVAALASSEIQTALPFSEDFLNWCVRETRDDGLIQKITDTINESHWSDDDWYALTGMTVKASTDLYHNTAEHTDNVHILEGDGQSGISLTFAGDISFADNWQTMQYLKATQSSITDCISPFLIGKMKNADISMINNEFCISDRGTPMKGKQYTFRATTQNVSLYETLGTDIVDLANNHIFDYGEDAFLDTLDTLKSAGIIYMGGGRNISEASKPQYFIVEGKKIAYVAATRAEKNILTPAAGVNSPGVLRCYDPSMFLEVIREAKQNADFVIANIHWGTEYSHALEPVQTQTAYQYIDAGADLIVGTHAHCLQGIEYYKHKPIIYNLGNFWFNEHDVDTGLLGVTLLEDDNIAVQFFPATQRNCQTTYVGGEAEGNRILQCIRSYSINAEISQDGTVTERK